LLLPVLKGGKMETIVNIDLLNKLTVEGRNKILSTAKQEFENEIMCGKVYNCEEHNIIIARTSDKIYVFKLKDDGVKK